MVASGRQGRGNGNRKMEQENGTLKMSLGSLKYLTFLPARISLMVGRLRPPVRVSALAKLRSGRMMAGVVVRDNHRSVLISSEWRGHGPPRPSSGAGQRRGGFGKMGPLGPLASYRRAS